MFNAYKKTNRTLGRLCFAVIMLMQLLPYGIHSAQAATETTLSFRQWLFEYIPVRYPDARMTDHGAWLQAHITEELVASWTQWNEKDVTLKYLEGHGLTDGKAIFIEKAAKTDWISHSAVTYIEGAGYYCAGYDSAAMSNWDVETCNIVQFDGDAKKLALEIAKAWAKVKPEIRLAKTSAKATAPAPVDFEINSTSSKLRVIMMSDFPPINVVKGGNVPNNQKSDPDDMQSIVRFLLYANEFDVEGLVTAAGTFAMEAHKSHMLDVLDRYEMVYENLKSHDPDYPTADHLRSVTYEGLGNNHGLSIKWGSKTQPVMDIIGEGKDSEASNAIIAAADKPDPRPLWIGVWGTPREVSQAIWRVRKDRSEKEFKAFLSKLRIFLIAYQDCTHGWLMSEFPDLFIIDSRKTYQGFFGGRDPVSNLAWVNKNIRKNHGPLCELYPHEGMGCTGVCEGDSPTFMHLVSANRGINNPEDPTQPGWGGQYKRKPNTNHYVDGPGGSSISRWRKDFQKEFAERADWCVEAATAPAPVTIVAPKPEPIAAPAASSTAAPKATSHAVFAVNCGGNAYTSSDGTIYAADTGFSGGLTYSNSESISETTDDTLYHSERYGDCTYSAPVPNGRYLVTFHFAETFHPEAGLRRFDVRMEGTEHVSDLDLYAKAGGNTAYVTQSAVTVSDGELNIEFVTDVENAKINAIKVSPAGSDSAINISQVKPLVARTVSPPKKVSTSNKTPKPTATPAWFKTRGAKGKKPRIIHTTDLGADPDDEQSMVRFLVCSNEFDTEGLIVSTGCWKKTQSSTAMLDKLVNAYAEVYDNLRVHADGFPTPDYLKSISVMGQRGYGMSDVGTGKDSPGSEMIIAAVDKDDPRPVWVGGWGGVNNMAQAIWKVRETRSEAELKKFISKLRVFDILGQDDAGAWLAKNFPDLCYIRATGVYGWQPPKNGSYQKEDIQSHGPLGAVYPNTKWATEGDTPAFIHVYPNGLNDPDQIDQGGWGGRFSFTKKKGIRSMSGVTRIRKDGETRYDPYYMYGNTPDKANAIKRWSKGYNNDFAARMDWTMTNDYAKVNHHPVAVVNGDKTRQVLEVSGSPGSTVSLSTEGSSDPDGNSLVYAWSFYKDPSSYKGSVNVQNSKAASAAVDIPSDASGKNIHMILELHDNGSPNLYAYRRVIINVQ